MVDDTDICIIPDNLCPAVIVGTLLRDKIGRGMLTQEWVAWYEKVIQIFRTKKDAKVYRNLRAPRSFMTRFSLGGDYDFSAGDG
jgi:hypothetical protein